MRRLLLLLVILVYTVSAQEQNATIQGYVKDVSGAPMVDVSVDIYSTDNLNKAFAYTKTDDNGFYKVDVEPGKYYDILVRDGSVNPKQRTKDVVRENSINTLNFEISTETSYSEVMIEKYGFWIVVVVAVIILFVILGDQLFMRRKRKIRALERERSELEERIKGEESGETVDEYTKLKREKDNVEYMLNLSKIKYHKRQLDEESFREIVRDYQKQLIAVEAKMNRLKTDK